MPGIRVIITVETDEPPTGVPRSATWHHTENHGDNPSFWGDAVRKTIHNAAKTVRDPQVPIDRIDKTKPYN